MHKTRASFFFYLQLVGLVFQFANQEGQVGGQALLRAVLQARLKSRAVLPVERLNFVFQTRNHAANVARMRLNIAQQWRVEGVRAGPRTGGAGGGSRRQGLFSRQEPRGLGGGVGQLQARDCLDGVVVLGLLRERRGVARGDFGGSERGTKM